MNFNIYAIPRSGHTAIINYLVLQSTKDKEYITNGQAEHNPSNGYSIQKTNDTLLITPHDYSKPKRKILEALIEYNHKQIIVDNQSMVNSKIKANISPYVNFTHKNIVIIRDIYNNLASIIEQRKHNRRRINEDSEQMVESWKTHAREYLRITKHLNQPTFILYNNWFQNRDYRKNIVKKLGLHFTDMGLEHVPHNGSGSSFDGMTRDTQASTMNVTTRWKHMMQEGVFHDVLNDKELINLNRRIFLRPNIEEFQHHYSWWYKLYSKYRIKYD